MVKPSINKITNLHKSILEAISNYLNKEQLKISNIYNQLVISVNLELDFFKVQK